MAVPAARCYAEAMLGDLSEKLMTHHVGGVWRAPLSGRMRPVRTANGGRELGCIVEADTADVARALDAARTALPAFRKMPSEARKALAGAALQSLRAHVSTIAQARALERDGDATAAWHEARQMLQAVEDALSTPPPAILPASSAPLVMLASARSSLALWGTILFAAILEGRTVVLKAAPRAAVAPTALMDAILERGDIPAGAINLLQGGGAVTGAALLAHPDVTQAVLIGKSAPRVALADATEAAGVSLHCVADPL